MSRWKILPVLRVLMSAVVYSQHLRLMKVISQATLLGTEESALTDMVKCTFKINCSWKQIRLKYSQWNFLLSYFKKLFFKNSVDFRNLRMIFVCLSAHPCVNVFMYKKYHMFVYAVCFPIAFHMTFRGRLYHGPWNCPVLLHCLTCKLWNLLSLVPSAGVKERVLEIQTCILILKQQVLYQLISLYFS